LAGLATLGIVPRLANLFLKPGVTYPLFGVHYALQQLVTRFSNSTGFNLLFGDSSYIVHFLRLAGYNLKGYTQTGSNFGAQQKHDNPFLCAVGNGTLISDGLTMANAEISATAFKLTPIRIGGNSFLGNNVYMPAGGKLGDNVLLATKVGIPIDGEVRESVGLLGSPAFEIPRSVKRDDQFAHLRSGPEFEARLRRKNLSNLVTIGLYLFTRWALFLLTSGLFFGAYLVQNQLGAFGYALATVAAVVVSATWYILIERLTLGFGKLTPQTCSIYEPYYWFHERHWKMSNSRFRALFNGTPFKNVIWRLLGTKVGKQLLDDGASMSERSLVSIGDYCTLGDLSMIEGHSMEDGAFKSDYIAIGNGVTIGANAFVNYGVEMGDNSNLLADSFLMKGTIVPAGQLWGGNPARSLNS
jgi:non-ribosomal peptide synthetase-like protein